MRVRALMTVEIGTPLKPITVPPGGEFEIDDVDPENLRARGIVGDAVGETATLYEGLTDADKAASVYEEAWGLRQEGDNDAVLALYRQAARAASATWRQWPAQALPMTLPKR